jgi:hypothetical protein
MVCLARADMYFHFPRGQNNRCDEKSNNRNNENRMYNSQDNAAGGYGWCDKDMFFYTNTILPISWYTQHSCGNGQMYKDDPLNPYSTVCQYILQLGCQDSFNSFAGKEKDTKYQITDGISLGRPGADRPSELNADPLAVYNTFGNTCTQTKPLWDTCDQAAIDAANANTDCTDSNLSQTGTGTFNSATCQCSDRKMKTYGYHEPQHWYQMCLARQRNGGLFTADQNVNDNGGATKDRQQPNSARYGMECTEERDYYPYWHPTPWYDLAIFTSNMTTCNQISAFSQNVMDKCHCVHSDVTVGEDTPEMYAAYYYNQADSCTNNGYTWKCWGRWNWPAPECVLAPEQSDNRLGNPSDRGDSQPYHGDTLVSYNWRIPESIIPAGQDELQCVLRIRYNISTAETGDDYDFLDNDKIKNNPVYTYGAAYLSAEDDAAKNLTNADHIPVRMAVNTAQFGRTFQDRTYVFRLARRPTELARATIHNLSVRGKRGNIAQVRNCLEYDFNPLILQVNVGDYVHFQWCGTDYNDNGNAGEGRAGTDRSNVVAVPTYDRNLPYSLNATQFMFDEADLKVLAWLNQKDKYCYTTEEMLANGNNGNDPMSCHFLNGVRDPDREEMPTAYFSYIAKVQRSGTFQYMSSRNNNFTNRSQKATITTAGGLASNAGAIAGIVIGGVAALALVGGLGFAVATKKISFGSFSSRV